jgi:hypothetical protein
MLKIKSAINNINEEVLHEILGLSPREKAMRANKQIVKVDTPLKKLKDRLATHHLNTNNDTEGKVSKKLSSAIKKSTEKLDTHIATKNKFDKKIADSDDKKLTKVANKYLDNYRFAIKQDPTKQSVDLKQRIDKIKADRLTAINTKPAKKTNTKPAKTPKIDKQEEIKKGAEQAKLDRENELKSGIGGSNP